MKDTEKRPQGMFARTAERRIADLQGHVAQLPVDENYRAALLASVERYRGQIIARPEHGAGWDDLEALQQVTLGDEMESYLRALSDGGNNDTQ